MLFNVVSFLVARTIAQKQGVSDKEANRLGLLGAVIRPPVLGIAATAVIAQNDAPSAPAAAPLLDSFLKELKLTDDQAAKLKEFGESMREKFQEALGLKGKERANKFQELAKEGEEAVADICLPVVSLIPLILVFCSSECPTAWATEASPADKTRKKMQKLRNESSEEIVTLLSEK
jgi:hypothetical protein